MNDTLLYGIATIAAGVLGVLISYSFKNKCSDVGLYCGLINIRRNIEAEIEAKKE